MVSEEQSQEQQRQAEQVVGKTRLSVAEREVALSPRRSYWPIVLAFALVIMLIGTISVAIIFFVGLVLVVGSVIGWALERR